MAHEFAHVFYKHKPYNGITPTEAQAQEVASDAFALDVMRRLAVPPAGMVPFFVTVSRLRSTPGDYATVAEYEAAVRREATHPVTAARLETLGRAIKDNASAFAAGQADPVSWRPRIAEIGDQIEAVGRTLDDRQFRDSQAKRNRTATPEMLARSCRR
jgi:predicted Zn-dependent protease